MLPQHLPVVGLQRDSVCKQRRWLCGIECVCGRRPAAGWLQTQLSAVQGKRAPGLACSTTGAQQARALRASISALISSTVGLSRFLQKREAEVGPE